MRAFRRSAAACAQWFLPTAPALEGCFAGSLCNPPGSTLGQIVKMDEFDAYRSRTVAQNGVGAPHIACRAEATIPTATTTTNANTAEGDDPLRPAGTNRFHMVSAAGGQAPQNVNLAEGQIPCQRRWSRRGSQRLRQGCGPGVQRGGRRVLLAGEDGSPSGDRLSARGVQRVLRPLKAESAPRVPWRTNDRREPGQEFNEEGRVRETCDRRCRESPAPCGGYSP
jgi:hypothetical protein